MEAASPTQRWGLTLPLPMTSLHDSAEHVRRAEAAGYTDVWSGETNGPDGFTPAGARRRLDRVDAARDRGRRRLSRAGRRCSPSRPRRSPTPAAGASRSGSAPRRTGSSRAGIEIPFERPLSKVDQTIDFLRPALAGERTANGFKLEAAPPPVPIILAALRGKMLQLAVDKADGAFTNFLPISGLAQVAGALDRAKPGFELLCRFFCLPGEREQIEPIARFMFASYVTVPVYAAFYRWLGHTDAIAEMCEAWAAKDRERAIAAAPWELIEEMFILGSPSRCASASASSSPAASPARC